MPNSLSQAHKNTRVLIVEDDHLLATDLSEHLRSNGVDVVGPIGTLRGAMEMVDGNTLDGAIVDIDLRGELAYPLLDLLKARDIPTIIATGFDRAALPPRFHDITVMLKPCDPQSFYKRCDMKRMEWNSGSAVLLPPN